MPRDTTIGVPHPDRPGQWLVPPLPAGADFHDVVRQFTRSSPWIGPKREHLRAYYVAYQEALDEAPTVEHPDTFQSRWYAEMRDCVARCVRLYRDEPGRDLRLTA